jgi:hypothetical protein
MFARINGFLDKYVLPWPVRFLTFRFVILATIALLLPLIVFANEQTFVLLVNSYLNTMSVAVSSIVLLYATISEVRQQKIAEMQEQRAEEDHTHVTEMHSAMLQALANQHEEIEDLKELIADIRGLKYTRKPALPKTDLHALHPRGAARFKAGDHRSRMAEANAAGEAFVQAVRDGVGTDDVK